MMQQALEVFVAFRVSVCIHVTVAVGYVCVLLHSDCLHVHACWRSCSSPCVTYHSLVKGPRACLLCSGLYEFSDCGTQLPHANSL